MRRVTFLPEPDFCFALSVNHSLWDLNDVTLAYGDDYCDAVKTTKIVSSLDFYNSKQRERFTRNGIKLSQLIGREMRCAEISLQKQLNVVVTEGLYWWLLLVFGSGGVREGLGQKVKNVKLVFAKKSLHISLKIYLEAALPCFAYLCCR